MLACDTVTVKLKYQLKICSQCKGKGLILDYIQKSMGIRKHKSDGPQEFGREETQRAHKHAWGPTL